MWGGFSVRKLNPCLSFGERGGFVSPAFSFDGTGGGLYANLSPAFSLNEMGVVLYTNLSPGLFI